MKAQVNLFQEIYVDNFAGGGGASTGIELATCEPVTIAINHDIDAVRLHSANHPFTEHLQTDVWDVDPVKVCAGRRVGLAWFSPDCKHFSRAKGAALVDRKIRGLAWIALRWAGTVRPRVIMLENVPEFTTWGPVRRGKPVKSKQGQTFQKFVVQLRELGYEVQWKELVAADYGAPTIRKRFVLVARCDGRPIVFPERTHAPMDSPEVLAGKLKPWRSAAEIIDWSIRAYSIFDSKQEIKEKFGVNAVRPLANNTLQRVIRGVDKFTIKSGKPFIVQGKFQNPAQSIDRPLSTVTAVGAHEIVEPKLTPVTFSNTGGSVGNPAGEPVNTIRSAGGQVLSAPVLIQYHTEQTENSRSYGLNNPLNTVDGSNRYGLCSANLVEYFSKGRPLDITEPLHTVTTRDKEALTAAHIVEFKGKDIGQHLEAPLCTITAGGGEFATCHAVLARVENTNQLGRWKEIRALLNKYCGYTMAEDEIILLIIGGVAYYIADILLRMLIPRELYNAMGFPNDYIIDHDAEGNVYTKTAQVAKCGNAVCPSLATAMVRANLPEKCTKTIVTMAQLMQAMSV